MVATPMRGVAMACVQMHSSNRERMQNRTDFNLMKATSLDCSLRSSLRDRPAAVLRAARLSRLRGNDDMVHARHPLREAEEGKASTDLTRRSSRLLTMHADMQRMQPPRVGARDAEGEATQRQLLASFGQMADGGGDQSADGVVFVVVEVGAEALVEIGDRGQRVDREVAVSLRGDQRVRVLGVVVLVVDLADDLFQHVLDRDQAGDAAV